MAVHASRCDAELERRAPPAESQISARLSGRAGATRRSRAHHAAGTMSRRVPYTSRIMSNRVRARPNRAWILQPGAAVVTRPRRIGTRRSIAWIVVAGVCLLSSAAYGATCRLDEAITYGTYVDAAGVTRPLLLDLLVPIDSPAPTPVIIWVHGGGWQSGTRTPIPTRAANMCSMGYAVASVDYRLTNVAAWPAQIQDVKGAEMLVDGLGRDDPRHHPHLSSCGVGS